MSEEPRERAEIWIEQGRPDRAEQELREALADDPNNPDTHVALALCLFALDRYEEALAEAEAAVVLAPELPSAHHARAYALLGLGRGRAAEAAARHTIELDPTHASAYGTLAAALSARQKWQASLDAAEEGLAVDPEDESCANTRAVALIQLGRAEEADFQLESALRRDPENPDTHRNLGWKALHDGRPHEAIVHYREALRLDPSDEAAREGLVEALKSRNIVYRLFLRFFLFLTKFEPRTVMLIFLGTIVARMLIRSVAAKVPALAPVLWPVFWALVAFVLLTWIASPLFNALLRLDRDGRHALTEPQVRQSNWLLATLGLGVVCLVLGFLDVPGGFVAAIVFGVLAIPVTATFEPSAPRRGLLAAMTIFLAVVGLTSAGLGASADVHRADIRAARGDIGLGSEEAAREAAKDLSPEMARELEVLAPQVRAMEEREQLAITLITVFLWGFVAFTWIASGLGAFRNE
jgi:tetratricopeptide (TPR) repeat protein